MSSANGAYVKVVKSQVNFTRVELLAHYNVKSPKHKWNYIKLEGHNKMISNFLVIIYY